MYHNLTVKLGAKTPSPILGSVTALLNGLSKLVLLRCSSLSSDLHGIYVYLRDLDSNPI